MLPYLQVRQCADHRFLEVVAEQSWSCPVTAALTHACALLPDEQQHGCDVTANAAQTEPTSRETVRMTDRHCIPSCVIPQESDRHSWDIRLEASIRPRDCDEETIVTRTNMRHLCAHGNYSACLCPRFTPFL